MQILGEIDETFIEKTGMAGAVIVLGSSRFRNAFLNSCDNALYLRQRWDAGQATKLL